MNIFRVSECPAEAARSLNDTHVRQMIFESCQLLNTAHAVLDGEPHVVKPAPSHHNHPCAKWVRENNMNYEWLARHVLMLVREHKHRFKTDHWARDAAILLSNCVPLNMPTGMMTQQPRCMDYEYKVSDDVVECYREYYRKGKKKLNFNYTNRRRPTWLRH